MLCARSVFSGKQRDAVMGRRAEMPAPWWGGAGSKGTILSKELSLSDDIASSQKASQARDCSAKKFAAKRFAAVWAGFQATALG